jgi:hypothetical protein
MGLTCRFASIEPQKRENEPQKRENEPQKRENEPQKRENEPQKREKKREISLQVVSSKNSRFKSAVKQPIFKEAFPNLKFWESLLFFCLSGFFGIIHQDFT